MAEPLRLLDTTKQTVGLVWENRIDLGKVVAAAGLVNGIFAWLLVENIESTAFIWVYFLGGGLVYTLLAVNVHRLVLNASNKPVLHRWTWRETRFLGWLAVIYFYVYLIFLIPLALLASPFEYFKSDYDWLWNAATLPGGYLFARLSLLLPATALDQRQNMAWAWGLTDKNGWRLLVLLWVLPMLIASAVPAAVSDSSSPIVFLIWHAVIAAGTALEIALLSVVFKTLGGLTETPPEAPAQASP